MTSKLGGYMGKMLDVNLTTGKVENYWISDDDRQRFLGGKALAAKILWDELPPGVCPLSPENIMVFTTGPLTGTGAPCSARFNLSTKSVATGGIASSNCGGDLGIRLKQAGWDGLIVRGAAKQPTHLEIDGAKVRLRSARKLWGKNTEEVQAGLGRKVATAAIGQAGENLVRYAAIMVGERALGRTGVGAVMGQKKLKLITVTGGDHKVPASDETGLRESIRKWTAILKSHPTTGEQLPKYGTAGLLTGTNATKTLPTENFRKGSFKSWETISGEYMTENVLVKNSGCRACPIRCGRVVEYQKREIKGPEYETLGMLGPAIGNSSLEHVIEWNYLCDLYGLDTISTGGTLACAMELAERGLLKDDGLRFGNPEGISEMIRRIALREGIGNDLAEGAMRLAQKYGAPELAMHAKGLELAAYEPRGAVGHGLGYATANRGGCHLNGGYLVYLEALGPITMDPHTTKAKPELVVMQQNLMEAISACGSCIFTSYPVIPQLAPRWYNPHGLTAAAVDKVFQGLRFVLVSQGRLGPGALPIHPPFLPHTKALSALMGQNIHMGRFLAAGERGFVLERLFNLREGLVSADDSLPPRLTDELQDPSNPDSRVRLDVMLPRYYKVRDWDARGIPSERLLRKLGMEFALGMATRLRVDNSPHRARRMALRAREEESVQEQLKGARTAAPR